MPSDTVKQLETFFESFDTLPTIPDTAGEVDLSIAVPVHIEYLKNNSGNIVFLPYYQRLVKWRKYLEENTCHTLEFTTANCEDETKNS